MSDVENRWVDLETAVGEGYVVDGNKPLTLAETITSGIFDRFDRESGKFWNPNTGFKVLPIKLVSYEICVVFCVSMLIFFAFF